MKKALLSVCLMSFALFGYSQGGLEDVIVEEYYVSDTIDASDPFNGGGLTAGSKTYRVFVDLAPGYTLSAVIADTNQIVDFSTTTSFYNNTFSGGATAHGITAIADATVGIDSYLSFGGGSSSHSAVTKDEDTDGSILGTPFVAPFPGFPTVSYLQDNTFPLTVVDGLIPSAPQEVLSFAEADARPSFSDNATGPSFSFGAGVSGSYFVTVPVSGPTASNRILIGQFTTDGDFSFHVNVSLLDPTGAVEQHVWENPNPIFNQFFDGRLTFPVIPGGCLDASACNYLPGAPFDDGSCVFPSACFECSGDTLALIDANNNGVCDKFDCLVSAFPYEQNFDGFTTCVDECNVTCSLSDCWENDATDAGVEWIVDANGTSTFGTGPSVDHTTGLGSGQYLYTESGSICRGSEANLLSPLFDLTGLPNATVSFWYHMYAFIPSQMGTLFVDVSNDSGATWIEVDNIRDSIDVWLQAELDLSAYLGDTVQVRLRGLVGTGSMSDMAIDDFSVFVQSNDDAGVASIDLTNPLTAGSSVSVPVTITNNGLNTITSATIDWSVNGAAQPSSSVSGLSIAPGDSASVTLGNFTFGSGLASVEATISLVNGNVDGNAGNNSAEGLFCSPLAGVYTLGAGGDFTSFDQLADILNSCGVSASVTVNVDAGTYVNQRLLLDHVPGLSSTSTLTIDGASAATMTNNLNMVALDGVDWTTIQNMTLISSRETVIWLTDSATGNTIDNCVITMTADASPTQTFGILGSENLTQLALANNCHMTTVSNNTITGGRTAVAMRGNSNLRDRENKILNNTISACAFEGISLTEQLSVEVIGNHVSGQTGGDGINIQSANLMVIANNTVINAPRKGLDIRDPNFLLPGNPDDVILPGVSQVYNNMVSSIADHALEIDDGNDLDVWNNTAYNTNSTNDAAFQVNDITNVDMRNNICASVVDQGFSSSDDLEGTTNTLDNNLYFSGSVNIARERSTNYTDLASWQAASPSLNANSVFSNPRFVNAPLDLHIFGVSEAINSGDNSVAVAVDIDGDARPEGSIVDMGADEYICTANVDLNGNGICDSTETGGCIDLLACNFTLFADTDDGSCIFPSADCDSCLNGTTVIIDSDGDGICDRDDPTPFTLPYGIAPDLESESCNVDTLCIPFTVNEPIANVIGFDIVYTYDATKVRPTGNLIYNDNLTVLASQSSSHLNINFNTGVINIACFLNDEAGPNTSFNGVGELFCLEFVKTAGHLSIDTVDYSATILESFVNGVEPSRVGEGTSISHQDTIFTGSLEFWLDNSPLVYDTANITDYLITNIFGTDAACGSESTDAVQPDTSGNFQYNIYNGEKISIQRDIAPTTPVMPSINTFDVLSVVFTSTLDTAALGFRPNAFQMIAMDVNLDGFVSAGDASQIFQRSVVTIPEYAQAFNYGRDGISNGELSKDWLFIDEQTTLNDSAYTISANYPLDDGIGFSKNNVPSVPFCLPIPVTAFDFSTADCPVIGDEDYIGILLGDIDGAFATAGTGGASGGLGLALKTASDNAINLDTRNGIINGNYLDIPVSVTASAGTRGLSFSTELTEGLVFESILEQSGEAIANVTAFDGRLNFATYNLASFVDGQTVATLRFKVESAVDMDNLFTPVYGFFEGIPTTVNDGNGNTPTNIDDFDDLTVVSVMPNPAKDELNVVVSEDANVQLLDVLGKEILIEERVVAGRSTKLNVSHLSDGVYFLKVYSEESTTVTRVVINN